MQLNTHHMKAILEFNLPDDHHEFEDAINGGDWKSVVWDINQYLRSKTKYAPDDMPEEAYKAYDECRERLFELINNNGLVLE